MQLLAFLLETAFLAVVLGRQLRGGAARLRRLLDAGHPAAQLTHYAQSVRRWWAYAAVAGVLMAATGTFPSVGWPAPAVVQTVGLLALGLAGSVAGAAVVPPYRRFLRWQLGKMGLVAAIYPWTARAAVAMVGLAITAGITEEFVFRGLAAAWATQLAAYTGAPSWLPLVLTSALFGLGHRYQGTFGVVVTGLLGAVLFDLTAETGTLLPAMVVHALVDLRIPALYAVLGPIPRVPGSAARA